MEISAEWISTRLGRIDAYNTPKAAPESGEAGSVAGMM